MRLRSSVVAILGLQLPALAALVVGCGKKDEVADSGTEIDTTGLQAREVDIPEKWKSGPARIAIRITEASTTDTEVYRAVNRLFNERIDVATMVMRGGLPTDADGNEVPLQDGPAALAGTSVEQARALVQRVDVEQGGIFTSEETVDACGNEMIATFVTPGLLQHVFDLSPTTQDIWPDACAGDVNCDSTISGSWDVAMTEERFDGMVDLVINLNPDASGPSAIPGYLGHLVGFFLNGNNPGYTRFPLIANFEVGAVVAKNLLTNHNRYDDPRGLREVYRYPAVEREVSQGDLLVAGTPWGDCLPYWEGEFPGIEPPMGCEQEAQLALDVASVSGQSIYDLYMAGGSNPLAFQSVIDTFYYQVGASVVCPTVEHPLYLAEGPFELFLCPDGQLDQCIADEDVEDFPCRYLPERDAITGFGAPLAQLLTPSVTSTWPGGVFTVTPGGTFIYEIDGTPTTLNLITPLALATADEVALALNEAEALVHAGSPQVVFTAGPLFPQPGWEDYTGQVIVSLAEASPLGTTLSIGDGTANDELGFTSGQSSAGGGGAFTERDPLLLYSTPFGGGPAEGYLELTMTAGMRLYTDEPERILAITVNGAEQTLPTPEPDSHCTDDGPVRLDLTMAPGTTFVVTVDTSQPEPLWMMASSAGAWLAR